MRKITKKFFRGKMPLSVAILVALIFSGAMTYLISWFTTFIFYKLGWLYGFTRSPNFMG